MNVTISIGNMTSDPKVTYFQEGKAKAEFTLALNRMKDGADFPRFVAWDKKAEVIEKYCHKGSKVAVRGHINTGSYEKDGQKVYTTDIVVDEIEFLDRKPKDGSEGQPTENPAEPFMAIPASIDEEIPF